MTFHHVHVGDKVRIHNKSDNVAFKAGFHTMTVVEEDMISFAVDCIGPWWFYRHDGKSYVGNATVVGILEGGEMNSVHICPVCNGVGTVPAGFYDPSPSSSTDAARETCRTCWRGIIVLTDKPHPPSKFGVTIKAEMPVLPNWWEINEPWGEPNTSGDSPPDSAGTEEG